ncbi:MAG: hypothetical protein ABMA64_12200 [Myxococcota bacterium]
MGGRVPADVRLFLWMMAAWVPARLAQTAPIVTMYVDGGYYAEVAQHVRDGEGLVSDVSLYHFGYPSFPYPTSVYPLWPWVLGMCGRVLDLHATSHWLPVLLSFGAVAAAFGFGRAWWPEPVFPRELPGLHAGHVFALGLAVQTEFVFFSSLPYTEPLAFLLLFLFLWRVVHKGADTGLGWAVEAGCWLGLLYLSRFQFLVAPMAMATAYAARLALEPRWPLARHAAVSLAVTTGWIGGWWLHLTTFVAHPTLGSLLRFDQNRANDLLGPIDVIVENEGPLDLLLDRALGVIVAWDPISGASYTSSFHTMHWALPLAIPFAVGAARDLVRQVGWRGVLARLRAPGAAAGWFVTVFALGALLSVHAIHKHYNGSWYFATRQGLMSLPAFLLPMAWLVRQASPLARTFGVVILGSTLVIGAHTVARHVAEPQEELLTDERHAELVGWLDARAAERGGRVVVAMDSAQVQRVAWRTTGVGYHWVWTHTSYADFLTMCDTLGAEYVVLRRQALGGSWAFLEDRERLARDFVQLPDPPDGQVVFQRRR